MFHSIRQRLMRFFAAETAGGIVLGLSALLALIVSNSPWSHVYEQFVHFRGAIQLGQGWLVLDKPMVVWVNDLWMAVFFFVVGLEIKREMLEGELASVRQAILPAVAALGGMVVPALIYVVFNASDAAALRGWAIPTATDIAFALGILILLGDRVPASLKVFLTAVAIMDDLGAIVVIALFYTADLSPLMLGAAGLGSLVLLALNRLRVVNVGPYVVVGLLVWLFVLKSGVHATLAGVVTALAIPMSDGKGNSPLRKAEHALHPWVAFAVLPMFAFVNAGVSLQGVSVSTLLQSIPLGIVAGLLFGKTIGVFLATWLMIRVAGASLPAKASWLQFLGVCVLCGVGFTMSLFIGTLAFEGLDPVYELQLKIGVLTGSALSGVVGCLILLRAPSRA